MLTIDRYYESAEGVGITGGGQGERFHVTFCPPERDSDGVFIRFSFLTPDAMREWLSQVGSIVNGMLQLHEEHKAKR